MIAFTTREMPCRGESVPTRSASVPALLLLVGSCMAADPSGEPYRNADAPPPAAAAASAPPAITDASARSWQEPVSEDVGSGATREQYLRAVQPFSFPEWAHTLARDQGLPDSLALAQHLNPFYQSGDFDGDGTLDVAALVLRRTTDEIGILLLHSGSGEIFVLGAGQAFGNGGTNFDWMTNWRVPPKHEHNGRADALEVIKLESGSAILYWDGTAYRWRQLGD